MTAAVIVIASNGYSVIVVCDCLALLPRLRSTYQANHSTEIVVLKVFSCVLLAIDSSKLTTHVR